MEAKSYPRTFYRNKNTELIYESFRASKKTQEALNYGIKASIYRITKCGDAVQKNYKEPEERMNAICKALRLGIRSEADWIKKKDGFKIVVVGRNEPSIEGNVLGLEGNDTCFHLGLEEKDVLLSITNKRYFRTIQKIIHSSIRKKFVDKGYLTIDRAISKERFDLRAEMIQRLEALARRNNIPEIMNFSELISLYTAVSFSAVLYDNSLYLDTSATTKMLARKTVWDLIVDNWMEPEIQSLGRRLSFDGGGTAYLTRILEGCTVDQPLKTHPFYGRTYRQYISDLYPYLDSKVSEGAFLLKAIPYAGEDEWTYGSCLTKPTLNYEIISNRNCELYSIVQNIFRQQAIHRMEIISSFLEELDALVLNDGTIISFENEPLKLVDRGLEVNFNEGTNARINFSIPPVLFFRRPELAFRDAEGNEVKTGYKKPEMTNKGTLTDLMINEKLCPYDAPTDVRLVALIPQEYKSEADNFCDNLENGVKNGRYRGFAKTFKVRTTLDRRPVLKATVDCYKQAVEDNIREGDYDSAIVFIPSKRVGQEFYSEPKLSLFQKKLPSQMITAESRQSKTDRSLSFKGNNDDALFNIALQLAAKSGIVSCALPTDCADRMKTSDAIIGYDVAEIPVVDSIPFDQPWSKERPSIPQIKLSCPLVVFDPQGSNIEHLGVYLLEQNNVFEGEQGDILSSKLPSGVKTFTIHKDGVFFPTELASLENWATSHDLSGCAVSIIKGDTPRITNLVAGTPESPYKGQTIKLSQDLFVMNTTGLPERIPGGYPRPITIKIDRIGNFTVDPVSLLGQIFAFSEIHSGALRGLRTPISTHFPNLIGQVLRKLERPFSSDVFLARTRNGKTPRWFY